jgi:lipopolysaccharide transport system permease protein
MMQKEIILKPSTGWRPVDFGELWRGRELFYFLVWRDIKIRYKQTVLGGLWAILQPLLAMLIFTLFFNRYAGIKTDAPYQLFAFTGLTLWTFFANSVAISSNSLIGNQQLVSKIYFPRLFIPLAGICALLMDLCVSLAFLGVLFYVYGWRAPIDILWSPVFVFATLLAAAGAGLILSALNVRFRDVKYAVPFFVQMGMFVSPVIYPLSYVPVKMRVILALNPMCGLIDGFRASTLGGTTDWPIVCLSLFTSPLLFIAGLYIFKRMERSFADII